MVLQHRPHPHPYARCILPYPRWSCRTHRLERRNCSNGGNNDIRQDLLHDESDTGHHGKQEPERPDQSDGYNACRRIRKGNERHVTAQIIMSIQLNVGISSIKPKLSCSGEEAVFVDSAFSYADSCSYSRCGNVYSASRRQLTSVFLAPVCFLVPCPYALHSHRNKQH